MIKFLSRFVSVSMLLGMLGCGGAPQVAPQAAAVPKAEPSPQKVQGQFWSLVVPGDWESRQMRRTAGDLVLEMVAKSKTLYGNSPVVVQVISTDALGDPKDFIMGFVAEMQENDSTQILRGRPIELAGGNPGALLIALHRLPNGEVVGAIDLIAADGERGYILTCQGEPEQGEKFGDLCVKVLSTFEMR